MTGEPLFLPRRLAIRLLSDAQHRPDGELDGVILARGGVPVSVHPEPDGAEEPGKTPWATYRSHPAVNWRPGPGDLAATRHPELPHLVISLDTKGVLQLRCWVLATGEPVEREVRVGD